MDVGPRTLGPTSGEGQHLAYGTPRASRGGQQYAQDVSQTVRPGHRGVVRHQSSGYVDVSSNLGKSNSGVGLQEVDPRPRTSYQLGRSLDHEGSMRVVWMTRSGITQVKSHWKRYDL